MLNSTSLNGISKAPESFTVTKSRAENLLTWGNLFSRADSKLVNRLLQPCSRMISFPALIANGRMCSPVVFGDDLTNVNLLRRAM